MADEGGHYVPRAKETTSAEAFLSSMRVNQHTGLIDPAWMIAASKKNVSRTKGESEALVYWLSMGPDNIGGRTTSVIYNQDKGDVYIGSMGGGVFRTTNHISWHQVGKNLMVSCMIQGEDGTIYVGTGDGSNGVKYNGLEDIDYANSFVGSGIYTIKDNVMSEKPLEGTEPTVLNDGNEWSFINDMAIDGNILIVATSDGVRYRDMTGDQPWAYAKINDTTLLKGNALKVRLVTHNLVAASVDGSVYVGDVKGKMECRSGESAEIHDSITDAITHIAPAPSEGLVDLTACGNDTASVIYAALIKKDGKNTKVYCSRDKGATWTIILPSADAYNVYNGKGFYNPGLLVDPANLDCIYVLGTDLWRLKRPGSQSNGYYLAKRMSTSSQMHGINAMAFDPKSHKRGYVGTDGGIMKFESDAEDGFSIVGCNRGYVSTRCLNVAPTNEVTRVVAGVLDHGAIMIKGLENTNTMGTCEILFDASTGANAPVNSASFSESYTSGSSVVSAINPEVVILTTKDGGLQRTESSGDLYDDVNFTTNQSFSFTGYRMPMALWECFNDENNTETVLFKCSKNQKAGDIVKCYSNNAEYPFDYELPVDMTYDTVNPDNSDSLRVPDPIVAKFFLPNASGSKHNIYVTFDALRFNKTADWYQIASITAYPTCMEIGTEGDALFIGTKQGKLFRIDNLRAVVNDTTANTTYAHLTEITLPVTDQCITSVAVYNDDNNKVVVTLGNYGNDQYVLYSDDALADEPTFVVKQGNLPLMPVYSSVYTIYTETDSRGEAIKKEGHVLIGTEHGVYRTTDIDADPVVWTAEGYQMGDVPVLDLKQQNLSQMDQELFNVYDSTTTVIRGIHNQGVIYAATYGRGLFRCETYHTQYTPESVNDEPVTVAQSKVSMYPNPVHDAARVSFELNGNTMVSYQVFDISGRMVKMENAGNYGAGQHEINVSVEGLTKGTYVLRLNAGSQTSSTKFVVF